MKRKVTIEILLVQESLEKKSSEIEDEILKEFREGCLVIPWGLAIESIKVVDLPI
jgi:hypothetical protein